MRLRNRGIGVGQTFYPFKRLPTELRQMIWRLTLIPRIVEVLWMVHDDDEDDPEEHADEMVPDDIEYVAHAPLPVALQTCKDSRYAVLGLYPLCFPSETNDAGIRFNFSLDTLYINDDLDLVYHRFMGMLQPTEVSSIKYLALCDSAGYREHSEAWDEYWEHLGKSIKNLPALKEFTIVVDALAPVDIDDLPQSHPAVEVVERYYKGEDVTRAIMFSEEYPDEIRRRVQIPEDELDDEIFSQHPEQNSWVQERARLVWGWRGALHPYYSNGKVVPQGQYCNGLSSIV